VIPWIRWASCGMRWSGFTNLDAPAPRRPLGSSHTHTPISTTRHGRRPVVSRSKRATFRGSTPSGSTGTAEGTSVTTGAPATFGGPAITLPRTWQTEGPRVFTVKNFSSRSTPTHRAGIALASFQASASTSLRVHPR